MLLLWSKERKEQRLRMRKIEVVGNAMKSKNLVVVVVACEVCLREAERENLASPASPEAAKLERETANAVPTR